MQNTSPFDRVLLKREARDVMHSHRPSVFLVALLFVAIEYILNVLSMRLAYPNVDVDRLMLYAEQPDRAIEAMTIMLDGGPGVLGYLLNLAVQIMEIMVQVGFVSFCLCAIRGMRAGYDRLFDAFGNFLRILWLSVLQSVFIFLWSLLLIVPGIIAAYRYSQAIYLLLDDPDKSAMTCLQESKQLTMGHKFELFLLDLSFLGWQLLALLPFVSIYVDPYITLTKANVYRALSGRLEPPEHVDVVI